MKWKWEKVDTISVMIIFIPIMLTLFYYNQLPDELAVHFNTSGSADGYESKNSFLITSTLMLVGIPLLLKISRYMDPKKKNYEKFETTYNWFRFLFTLFLSVMYITLVFYNVGYDVNIQLIVVAGVGILFVFLGNYMSRIRFNYSIGIRTPWTLASEEVWRKTHRLAGPMWLVGGILIIISAFIPGDIAFILLMIVLAVITIIPIIYSYILFTKQK